jgi:hypothetical protein
MTHVLYYIFNELLRNHLHIIFCIGVAQAEITSPLIGIPSFGRPNQNYKKLISKNKKHKTLNSIVWVCERTIQTERPPLVSEVIANLCG